MALNQASVDNSARWSVMWLGPKGIVEKKYDTDFGGALEAFALLRGAGKKLVTLRCCNVGFPPPEHILKHEVVTYRVVRRGGKRYKKKVITYVDQMLEHNEVGIWWCPYCIKLRPFKMWKDWNGQQHMRCPVCHITERDWHVKRWNPKAKTIEYRRRRRGRTNRRQRRR